MLQQTGPESVMNGFCRRCDPISPCNVGVVQKRIEQRPQMRIWNVRDYARGVPATFAPDRAAEAGKKSAKFTSASSMRLSLWTINCGRVL